MGSQRWIGPLLVLMVAASLVGCTMAVEGEVVSETTGEPLAGVGITAGEVTAVTGEDGQFILEGVVGDQETVTLIREGFPDHEIPLGETTSLSIAYPDAAVDVLLSEIAAEPSEVESCSVSINISEALLSRDGDGVYSSEIVPVTTATVTVSGEQYESQSIDVTLTPGVNEVSAALSLTPIETYRRYYDAYSYEHWGWAYKYLHLDTKQNYPLEDFERDMSDSPPIVSIDFTGTRTLDEWYSKWTGKTYKDVAQVDRDIVMELLGSQQTDRMSQNWVKVDGVYYLVFTQER